MKSAVITNLIINIALSGSLNILWSMINTLQITLHMPAINTKSPSNAQYLNNILIGITQFEVLPRDMLRYFYFWNVLDGTYFENEEEFGELIIEMEQSSLTEANNSTEGSRR